MLLRWCRCAPIAYHLCTTKSSGLFNNLHIVHKSRFHFKRQVLPCQGTIWNDRRCLHHSASETSPEHSPKEDVVLYQWPTMRHFRFISRFKVYQVSTMLLLLPPIGYWYYLGEITTKGLVGAGIAALGTTAVLFIVSHYFRRVIGEMVYCSQNSSVKVSTLTFMGGRRNLCFAVDRIVPFIDSQMRIGGAIQRLEVRGHPEVFLYSLRFGHVLDSELMRYVLGIPTL